MHPSRILLIAVSAATALAAAEPPTLAPLWRWNPPELARSLALQRPSCPPVLVDGGVVAGWSIGGSSLLVRLDRGGVEQVRVGLNALAGRLVASAGGPLLVIGERGLDARDARTLARRWQVPMEAGDQVEAANAGDAVLLAEPGRLRCLDAASGAVRWQRPTAARTRIQADGDLAVVEDAGELLGLALRDGSKRWKLALPLGAARGGSTGFIADLVRERGRWCRLGDRIALVDGGGVRVLDPATGATVWYHGLVGVPGEEQRPILRSASAVWAGHGALAVRDGGDRLRFLDARDGRERSRLPARTAFSCTPHAHSEGWLVGGLMGDCLLLRPDGRSLARLACAGDALAFAGIGGDLVVGVGTGAIVAYTPR